MQWQKITLIGVGLLGGSLGLAIRQRGLAKRVVGFVRRAQSIAECRNVQAVDEATQNLIAAVHEAELVIFCTPIAQMRPLAEEMLSGLRDGAIVTDVGSVKASVVRELESLFEGAGAHFVGSHPMAGAEKMGVSAARASLFQGALCVITPTNRSAPDAVETLKRFWGEVGARPILISPEQHDELVSRSSHLVHVVAAGLASYVLDPAHPKEQSLLCANGFRDTTRIASGSPEMWRDIAVANRANLSRELRVFVEELQRLQLVLDHGDTKGIQEFFEQARERRDQWRGPATSPSPE